MMTQAQRPIIRVAVIDGEAAARERLAQSLSGAGDLEIVGSFETAEAFLAAPRLHRRGECDVLLTNVALPGGCVYDFMKRVAALETEVAVIVVSDDHDPRTVSRVLAAGAAGFVSAGSQTTAVCHAIRAVHAGLAVSSIKGACAIRSEAELGLSANSDDSRRATWELVSYGYSNSEIAAKLFMSESTVKHQVSSLMRLFGVRNRVELTNLYWQRDVATTSKVAEPESPLATLEK